MEPTRKPANTPVAGGFRVRAAAGRPAGRVASFGGVISGSFAGCECVQGRGELWTGPVGEAIGSVPDPLTDAGRTPDFPAGFTRSEVRPF